MNAVTNALERLAAMSSAELSAEWRRVYRASSPPLSPDLLKRGIAWRLQEKQFGGLTPAAECELARAIQPGAGAPTAPVSVRLRPGSRLVRNWNGTTYSVLVTDSGYEMDGQIYRSLSNIAQAITGTKWSGPRFFGLKTVKASRNA